MNEEIKTLERKINELQNFLTNDSQNCDILKLKLQNILHERTEGTIIKSRIKYYEEGKNIQDFILNL